MNFLLTTGSLIFLMVVMVESSNLKGVICFLIVMSSLLLQLLPLETIPELKAYELTLRDGHKTRFVQFRISITSRRLFT